MAVRPLVFGARLREKGRSVRVRAQRGDARRYVLEDAASGRATRHRDHASLGGALRDLAKTWRERLN